MAVLLRGTGSKYKNFWGFLKEKNAQLTYCHDATGSLIEISAGAETLNDDQIETVLKNTIAIDLSQRDVYDLPQNLPSCPSLSSLDLSDNLLFTLPDSISYLRGLKEIDLSRNPVNSLPHAILQIPALQSIKFAQKVIANFNLQDVPAQRDQKLQAIYPVHIRLPKQSTPLWPLVIRPRGPKHPAGPGL